MSENNSQKIKFTAYATSQGRGHAEFSQAYHQAPYGYTTQTLSSVASNSGHDINKPVAAAQKGMYSSAGMPAPAQHHQSMGGPIASPQPIMQQGQQISRNQITMPAHQQRPQYPAQYSIMPGQQYLWNTYNTPPPQNANGYFQSHGMSSYQSLPPQMPPQPIPAQPQQQHREKKAIPIIDPKTGKNVLSTDKKAEYSSPRPSSEKESESSDSDICVQFATQVAAVLNDSRSDIASKQLEPVRIDTMCSHENEGMRIQETPESSDSNICVQFATQVAAVLNDSRSDIASKQLEPVRIDTMCSHENKGMRIQETPDTAATPSPERPSSPEIILSEEHLNVIPCPGEGPHFRDPTTGTHLGSSESAVEPQKLKCELKEGQLEEFSNHNNRLHNLETSANSTAATLVPTPSPESEATEPERAPSPEIIINEEHLNVIPCPGEGPHFRDPTTGTHLGSSESADEPQKPKCEFKEIEDKIGERSLMNPEGRKKYDREFLLKLQNHPLSLRKLCNLPNASVIKDKPLTPEDQHSKKERREKAKKKSSSPTKVNPQTQMSMEKMKKHLLRLLEKNSELEEVFDWVDANVSDTSGPFFVRALVTAVHESCLSGSGTTWELNSNKLKSRIPLISRYVSTNEKLQLQALYAVQALWNKLGHPIGLLHQIFDVLFDDDVISDESFKEWEQSDDPNEAEGKGVSVRSMKRFFSWLREPEEETEEMSSV